MDSSCGCVQSQNGESHITVSFNLFTAQLFQTLFQTLAILKMAMSETTKKHPSKHPTCIKQVHLQRQFSGINLYPAILRRQEWTHPEAISQILGRPPRPNCFSLMRRVIFLGRNPWWLVVSFFGEDILPQSTGNWYKPNNPPILRGFRKQKTRNKIKAPQNIPNQRIGWNSWGTVTKKKAESTEINGSSDPSS